MKRRGLLGLCSLFIALTALINITFGWSDNLQHKTNEFKGIDWYMSVILKKYAKPPHSTETAQPLAGAVFELYRVNNTLPDEQIGARFIT
ncbi:MAG: prealbumin-like fold domain-containing protein, partial [Clostridiales bacterium]|nr:prealbumin-like fold domain-containing protein [Clostridiales bacterium]